MSTDKPHLIRIDNLEIRTLDRKVVIGRHPGCDYVLSLNDRNIGISGRHASVEADGETAWLEDLGSTNGTWVQGERIGKRTRLVSGDRFQLDRLEFEFRAAVKPAAPPKPPASPPPPEPPRAPTTVAVNLEDLALPSPAQLKEVAARTAPPNMEPRVAPPAPPPPRPAPEAAPPPPPPPLPPPPKPEPVAAPAPAQPMPVAAPPPVAEAAPAPAAAPLEPAVVPKTVEVKALPETPPPAPKVEPVAAPPPPPPPPPAPKAPPTDAKPQKVAGSWVNADHSGKTKILMPGERQRLKEQMGSGLYAAAEAVSVPTLLFAAPEERRVTLAQRDTATQEWTIGSNADVDVSIPSDGLSGLHAKILRNGQTWTISDLMSANGTFVNGQKINRSHLESGNQLGFGPVLCTFLLPEGSMAPMESQPATAKPERKRVALPLPLLLGGAVLALALVGVVIYLLVR